MLFKSLLFVTLASVAFASPAPGGEWDKGDSNWGKDKCYVKQVTYYKTATDYKTNTDYISKTKKVEIPYTTKIPYTSYYEKVYTKTEDKVETFPVTKVQELPYTKSEVKDEKVCKTAWKGDKWDYDEKKW